MKIRTLKLKFLGFSHPSRTREQERRACKTDKGARGEKDDLALLSSMHNAEVFRLLYFHRLITDKYSGLLDKQA